MVVRHSDVEGALFPWRLGRSKHTRSFRLPRWLGHPILLWAWFERVRGWSMAQWADFLTCHQIARVWELCWSFTLPGGA